jgi:hypothetical protein
MDNLGKQLKKGELEVEICRQKQIIVKNGYLS